jgi:hypothetical protein
MESQRENGRSVAEVRIARLSEQLDAVSELTPPMIVRELIETLGTQLVAAIAGVGETRLVRQWERGEHRPRRERTLIAALQATRAILTTGSPTTARSWFVGCSSRLDYISPLEVIREHTPEARRRVIRAAIGFATQ